MTLQCAHVTVVIVNSSLRTDRPSPVTHACTRVTLGAPHVTLAPKRVTVLTSMHVESVVLARIAPVRPYMRTTDDARRVMGVTDDRHAADQMRVALSRKQVSALGL